MSKKSKVDYFNLNSDDDNGNDDEDNNNDRACLSKWDWTKPENVDLYSDDVNNSSRYAVKHGLNENFTDVYNNAKGINSIETTNIALNENELLFNKPIEKLQEEFVIENTKNYSFTHKCNLFAHKDSVNRIHWCKQNSNLLLSSSMDG